MSWRMAAMLSLLLNLALGIVLTQQVSEQSEQLKKDNLEYQAAVYYLKWGLNELDQAAPDAPERAHHLAQADRALLVSVEKFKLVLPRLMELKFSNSPLTSQLIDLEILVSSQLGDHLLNKPHNAENEQHLQFISAKYREVLTVLPTQEWPTEEMAKQVNRIFNPEAP